MQEFEEGSNSSVQLLQNISLSDLDQQENTTQAKVQNMPLTNNTTQAAPLLTFIPKQNMNFDSLIFI